MNRTSCDHSPNGTELELVALLVESPSARVALLNSSGRDKSSLLQSVRDTPRVRGRFGGRRFFLSCHDAPTSEIFWSRLAAELGLETPDADDTDVAIAVVLDELAAYDNTLIIIDRLEVLYSGSPAQQDATDLLLAVLAAVDEVTLLVSFSGSSLPECVHWSPIDDHVRAPISVAANASNPVSGTKVSPSPPPPLADSDGIALPCSATTTVEVDAINTDCAIHGTERPPGPPTLASSRRLPPRPTVFHGRDKELERLVQQISVPNSAPLGIVGPGGIGKTTLALKVLHHPRTRESFSARFFVSYWREVVTGHSIWEVVIKTLRSNKRTFLLIDNFESIWSPTDQSMKEAAEVFLAQLAVLEEVTILVTTRGNQLPEDFSWANAATAELDTLSSTAARQVFCDLTCLKPEILAAEPENSALTQLLKEVDFVPLAITLLSRLDDLPSRLLREWLEYFTEVLEADQHDGTRRELSVEVSIKISLAHLPPETAESRSRQLLSVCGQLPAGLYVELSDHLGSSIPCIDAAADNLLRHSLVYAGNLGELRMLSPVRHHVSHNLPMDDLARFGVECFYLSLACRAPLPPDRFAIEGPAFDLEMPNVLSILTSMADRPSESLVRSVNQLVLYSMIRGQSPPLAFVEKVLFHVGDHPRWMATCLDSLGRLHLTAGDLETASRCFEPAAELHGNLGNKDGAAKSLMGQLVTTSGKNVENMSARWAELDLQRVFSDAGRSDMAHFHDLFGMEPAATAERLRSKREAHIQAGHLPLAIVTSWRLGKAKEQLDDIAGAIQEYEAAITLGEQGAQGSDLLARVKLDLAKLHLGREDFVVAENLLGEAYAIFSARDDQHDLAHAIRLTAILRLGQSRSQEAAENLDHAARLFRERGEVLMADRCSKDAGQVRDRLSFDKERLGHGDIAGPIQEYESSITLGERGAPESDVLARAKLDLARVHLDRNDFVAAENLLGEAYAVFSARDDQRHLAQTIRLTARLRVGQRRLQEAAENFDEAARLYRERGDLAEANLCVRDAGEVRRALQAITSLMQDS